MPFITEELWQSMGQNRPYSLVAGRWPMLGGDLVDENSNAEMDWTVRVISQIRAVRAEMNVPPAAKLPLLHLDADAKTIERLGRHGDLIERLARIESIEHDNGDGGKGSVQIVVDETTFALPLGDVIDLGAERARLEKEIGKLDQEIAKFDKKLANESFTAKAPPEVVETERERRAEAAGSRQRLAEALTRLSSAM